MLGEGKRCQTGGTGWSGVGGFRTGREEGRREESKRSWEDEGKGLGRAGKRGGERTRGEGQEG